MMARRTEARRRLALGVAAFAALGLAGCEDMLNGPAAPEGYGQGYGYPPAAYRPRPAPPPGPVQPPAFSPQEFAWSVGQGSGVLSGRVAYHAQSGEHWTCAGQAIALIPATRYSAARMLELYGSQDRAVTPRAVVQARNTASPGVDYGAYVRTSACSAKDGFSFGRLPPGPYFLIAGAHPRGRPAGPNDGVVILQRVDIAPGPTRIVVPAP
jgi:hypothetical protein